MTIDEDELKGPYEVRDRTGAVQFSSEDFFEAKRYLDGRYGRTGDSLVNATTKKVLAKRPTSKRLTTMDAGQKRSDVKTGEEFEPDDETED